MAHGCDNIPHAPDLHIQHAEVGSSVSWHGPGGNSAHGCDKPVHELCGVGLKGGAASSARMCSCSPCHIGVFCDTQLVALDKLGLWSFSDCDDVALGLCVVHYHSCTFVLAAHLLQECI
jgi:hypothetical protein